MGGHVLYHFWMQALHSLYGTFLPYFCLSAKGPRVPDGEVQGDGGFICLGLRRRVVQAALTYSRLCMSASRALRIKSLFI